MVIPRTLPNYEVTPLRSENISIGIIQSRVRTINPDNAEADRKANLDHVLHLIDIAQQGGASGKKDLLVFYEYPLSGFSFAWSREQALKIAIDIPGQETAALGEKAKQYGC